MAVDRVKIENAVQKHLQKGAFDKAIKELQRLVDADPKDLRTLLKIGELYAKMGDKENAAATHRRVADAYMEQGFAAKALSVFKQILEYDPDNAHILLKLADTHRYLGQTSEALGVYHGLAAKHEAAGRVPDALAVWGKAIELSPDDIAARVRVAEGYGRQGMKAEAAEHMEKAVLLLETRGPEKEYLKAAERLIHYDPTRIPLIKKLARTYLKNKEPKRALEKLKIALKADQEDIETLSALGEAFNAIGQVEKTILVTKELARVLDRRGRADEARRLNQLVDRLSAQAKS